MLILVVGAQYSYAFFRSFYAFLWFFYALFPVAGFGGILELRVPLGLITGVWVGLWALGSDFTVVT